MPHEELQAALRSAAPSGRVFVDDFGNVGLAVRRDMTHLEADALSDRLAAWTRRSARHRVPHVDAFVSFHHARPGDEEEAEADLEAVWHEVEGILLLHLERPAAAGSQRAFLDLVPEFLRLVDEAGRPVGWRRPDMGAAE